ncbi:MAG: Fic family protein, partial [Candidatus Diapherotrites archaeon]|nr:Fic family protein [Candidatus Diapherotrites archaeon]
QNIDSLVQAELDLRKPCWEKAIPMAHNPELIEKVETKAILLNNLIETQNAQKRARAEFAKEFIYNSNNIEGSRIPKEILVELFEKGSTPYKNKNEVLEVKNSIKTFDYLEKHFSFTMKGIKRLYYLLTNGMNMENGNPYPNGFKKTANIVGDSPTTAPENVETELRALLKWNKTNRKTMYPFQRAFEFHCRYERIHPFQDANGRTGRLLLNKILLQNNYPPIIVYKDNKRAYFNSIRDAQEGNTRKYHQFMLEQAQKTYDQMIGTLSNHKRI